MSSSLGSYSLGYQLVMIPSSVGVSLADIEAIMYGF